MCSLIPRPSEVISTGAANYLGWPGNEVNICGINLQHKGISESFYFIIAKMILSICNVIRVLYLSVHKL